MDCHAAGWIIRSPSVIDGASEHDAELLEQVSRCCWSVGMPVHELLNTLSAEGYSTDFREPLNMQQPVQHAVVDALGVGREAGIALGALVQIDEITH